MNCQTKCPAIRVVMFPKDTNPSGNIFGGVILSYIDIAAGVAARAVTQHRTVTVLMKEVQFRLPVKVGDILTFWADVVKTGRTSVTIRVRVEADRRGEIIPVTEGEAIFVAVDEKDRPIPLGSPLGTQGGDNSQTESKVATPAATRCDHSSASSAPVAATVNDNTDESKKESKQNKKNKKNKKEKNGGKKKKKKNR